MTRTTRREAPSSEHVDSRAALNKNCKDLTTSGRIDSGFLIFSSEYESRLD